MDYRNNRFFDDIFYLNICDEMKELQIFIKLYEKLLRIYIIF
jgi:hypothetical protein